MRFSGVLRNLGNRARAARDLLELTEGASKKEIHTAYLKLAKTHHPDIAINSDLGLKNST